jgi:isopenicillin N synthase-like dioxygenase
MSLESLPQIDISPFLHITPVDQEARRRCAEDICKACTYTGFFYLTNHGIPTSQTDAVLSLGRDFFLNSSAEEKQTIVRKKVGVGNGDGARGWQPVRDNMTGGKRDWQEAVDMYREPDQTETVETRNEPPYDLLMGKNLWPQRPEALKETYENYITNVLQLGEVVCTAMGAALGFDEEVFTRHTKKSFWGMRLIGYVLSAVTDSYSAQTPHCCLIILGTPFMYIGCLFLHRFNRHTSSPSHSLAFLQQYAPIPDPGYCEAGNDGGGIGCGEHTDYGCVTLLLTDDAKGALQVKSTSGS